MWANKAESACRSCQPSGPHPFPSYYTDTRKRTHAIHIHTSTHAHTRIIKCPTHNIPETIFKLLSVNKQTPTYSSDRSGADVEIDLVHTGCCLCSFFFLFSKLCAILCLFLCMIQTMFTCVILHQSNISSTLQVAIIRCEWNLGNRVNCRRWLASPVQHCPEFN